MAELRLAGVRRGAVTLLLVVVVSATYGLPQNPYDPYQSKQTNPYGPQLPPGGLNPNNPYADPLSNNNLDQGSTTNYSPYDPTRSTSSFGSYSTFGGLGGLNNIDGLINENDFCPEFWMAHHKTCYRFQKSPKRNWHEARKLCRAMGGDLLHADSIDKHSFVLRELIVQDQRQNRYYVSARQQSPNVWINDDNSPLVQLEDGLAYDETSDLDDDTLQENLNERQRQILQNPLLAGVGFNNGGPNQRYEKTRLVYGFSRSKDRWLFIPSYEFEPHLFICESQQLYNPNNVNALQDDKRTYDYGLEITDERRIPRGPRFVKQPRDTTFDTSHKTLRDDVTISCLANGYPTPEYVWFKEEFINDNLTYTSINPLIRSYYTTSGGNLIIHHPEQSRDQGTYHCVARNKYGAIRSNSIQLNFGYIMEFNLKRSGESGDSNWGKALFCDPPQHYPSVKYYWSRDFFPNFVEEDQRVFVSNDGALYFSALEPIDRGNYSCTVQSVVSSTGRNGPFFPLRVKPRPDYQTLLFANSFPKIFPEAPVAGSEVRPLIRSKILQSFGDGLKLVIMLL